MKASILNYYYGFLFLLLTNIIYPAQIEFKYQSDYLSGYDKALSGQTINYYTIGAQSIDALLVRSLDSKEFIEWETEAVPAGNKEETISFIMLASLQVTKDSHRFDIYLNNKKYFSLVNPSEKSLNPILLDGNNGSRLTFSNLEFDRFDDLTGFLTLRVPSKEFENGKPVKIRIEGESAKSRTWFMVFKHNCKSAASLSSENIILNTPGEPKQSMRVKIFHMTAPAKASIKIGGVETNFDVKFGYNYLLAGLDRIKEEMELPVEFRLNGKVIGSVKYSFKPVSPVTIYLLPHSHVDIGYTNVQEEVKKIQWEHIEKAIELGNKTINFPEGAKFKWNTEVMWAPVSYLKSAPPEKREKFIDAVQKGILGIDGIYANMMTGLLSPEEWIRMTNYIKEINGLCNIKIESAMISDVPGWSWSMVPMLANAGIKYFSCGINQGDRIGSIRGELGDKPFYWVSPSGKEKILTWVHEQGYSAFHYVPKTGTEAGYSVIEPTLINYTNKLADEKYPYDIIPLHYTIGSDNGPTDKYLSENIKKWNEAYLSPRVVIATTAEFFKVFEKKYGTQLPEIKGDITPYWEDGAASSAKETALNRQTADKLTHAQYLTAQYSPAEYKPGLFADAWQNVILYDEHTWGSWNSISEPDIDFTIQQWKTKQKFALDASKQADDLFAASLKNIAPSSKEKNALDVINSSPAVRTAIVAIPEEMIALLNKDVSLLDEEGKSVVIQKLINGKSVFLASGVPAMGSKRYYTGKAKDKSTIKAVTINSGSIENEFIRIEIDSSKGVINKIVSKEKGFDIVNSSGKFRMGEYLYVSGRKPDNPVSGTFENIRIKENGPLVSSLALKLHGEGCNTIEQEISLTAGESYIDVQYTFDKQKIYTPEAVRVAFPFNVPGGVFRIENAYGYYQQTKEQIKGSCKNFYTINNYIDLSNQERGITLYSPDAPIVETGSMSNDANTIGWLDTCLTGPVVFSFIMNNYWHTNFCATQEGKSSFRYRLLPHDKFNPAPLALQGMGLEQPFISVACNKDAEPLIPQVRYNNPNVTMLSIQPGENGKSLWVAFYNNSDTDTEFSLLLKNKTNSIFESDLLKNKIGKITSSVSIPAKGTKYLLIDF